MLGRWSRVRLRLLSREPPLASALKLELRRPRVSMATLLPIESLAAGPAGRLAVPQLFDPGTCVVVHLEGDADTGNAIHTRHRTPTGKAMSASPADDIAPAEPSLALRLRALLAPPLEQLLPGGDTILEWPAELFPYQLDGVRTLLERDRLLLADDMGLGKTIQAAAAIRILCLQRRIERILLIVPASLVDQWRRELARWAPELRLSVVRGAASDRAWQWRVSAHVTIVGYETFRSDCTDSPDSPPRRYTWDLVILDEAQKIKNAEVDVSRKCKLLPRHRSWAMTGTPLENRLEDLASVLEFVDHQSGTPRRYFPGPQLLARHKELQLRRRKSDVLDQLPPKQVIHVSLDLLPAQRETYTRAEHEGTLELRAKGLQLRIEHVLELILRLKQICNFCPRTGESAKLDELRSRLRVLGEEGHRALVFSQFTDDDFGVRAIARAFEDFNPMVFVGSMSATERDAAIRQFKTRPEHRVLILSLRSGGVGLNLQEASYVFHFDRWWNPAVERQAEDRSHRMGQTVPVTVFKYTAISTIEEKIHRILTEKQLLFDEIVDDVSLDIGTRLTSDELFGLFGVERPSGTGPAPRDRQRSGLALEERCERLLLALGWSVERTPLSRDGGVDLVAVKVDEVGVGSRILVQCKDYARPVGVEVVRQLLGVLPLESGTRGLIAAPQGLTADAARIARERGVVVWDEERIASLENQH